MSRRPSQKKNNKFPKFSFRQILSFRQEVRGETTRFLIGIFLFAFAIFLTLSMISNLFTGAEDQSGVEAHQLTHATNWCGKGGAYLSYFFMNRNFGIASFFIPVFLLTISMKLTNAYKVRLWKWFLNCSFLMIWISIALTLVEQNLPDSIAHTLSFRLGGMHGRNICARLSQDVGEIGTWIIVLIAASCYLIYVSNETINIIRKILTPQEYIKQKSQKIKTMLSKASQTIDTPNYATTASTATLEETDEPKEYEDPQTISLDLSNKTDDETIPPLVLEENIENSTSDIQQNDTLNTPTPIATGDANGAFLNERTPYDPKKDLENYKYPTQNLLHKYADNAPAIDMAEQKANKDKIISILRNFGVEISSIKATIGPTITLYEITPAQGVRISKIRNLEDDIALSLSALGIRIIAPIPGKGTIGIEVPNKKPQIVSMESIINSKKFQETKFELPIALGKTITNEVFMVDLAKMPHLLVAGATGQGKSVGLNAIITSLLYKKHPAELKLVLVDPKKVEFSIYAPIERHFLAKIAEEKDPIITDVKRVVQTLNSLCQLMDHRYDLLKMAKVRNIKEYNAKFNARLLNPEKGHEFMPYIVVIIDEFGDLIMTAGKDVELPIARIAQLARAVGIHMVIATQRPTTNIITGTIKANFPARMAFKVMSQIDSRTILDRSGANQLVGKGDMLFLCNTDPVRVQCAFVDTDEVENINNYIAQQQAYPAAFELPEVNMDGNSEFKSGTGLDSPERDPMFAEVARLVVSSGMGSTSSIQRKFSIGYNRAGRLMDQLEEAGIVGPAQGSKPREVLVYDLNTLENILNS